MLLREPGHSLPAGMVGQAGGRGVGAATETPRAGRVSREVVRRERGPKFVPRHPRHLFCTV